MKNMRRIFTSVLLVLMLLMCMAPAAMAAGTTSTVDITGKHDTFLFSPGSSYSKTDLFPNFKDVMPGDTLTQEVRISHNGIGLNSLKVYVRVVPHNSSNQPVSDVTWQESNDFLSQLDMKIYKGKDLIFNGHPNEVGGLGDYLYLGRMHKGNSMTLNVELTVPLTLDNEYANRLGEMDWEFMVEEIPSVSPKTGDESNIGVMMAVCGLSLAALIVVVVVIVKKKKKN